MSSVVERLTDDDIRGLAEYYSGQTHKPSGQDEALDPQSIARGKSLYKTEITRRIGLSCGDCHGENAEGQENRSTVGLVDFPRLGRQKRDYLVWRLRKYASREVGYGLLGMNVVAASLTESEINDIAAYLSSLK